MVGNTYPRSGVTKAAKDAATAAKKAAEEAVKVFEAANKLAEEASNVLSEAEDVVDETINKIMAVVNAVKIRAEDAWCFVTCADLLNVFGKDVGVDVHLLSIDVRNFIIALLETNIPGELLHTRTAEGETFWHVMCNCVMGKDVRVPKIDKTRAAFTVAHFRLWLWSTLRFVPFYSQDLGALTTQFREVCGKFTHPSRAYSLKFIDALKVFVDHIAGINGIPVPYGHWDRELDAMRTVE